MDDKSQRNNRSNRLPGSGPQRGGAYKFVGLMIWIALFVAMLYAFSSMMQGPQLESLSYTKFKQEVSQGNVQEITMQGKKVTGTFTKQASPQQTGKPAKSAKGTSGGPGAATSQAQDRKFQTLLPPINDPDLMKLLESHNVTLNVKAQSSNGWLDLLLIGVLPWVLIIGFFVYMTRRAQGQMGGAMGDIFRFGKSQAKKYQKGPSDVTFNDVAGLDNAKRDLLEIIEYLKSPERYQKIGAKLPRGILLMGPPGTGKTLLAKAVAGEASVPFFSISGSEFVEMFVGVGASRVRDMFATAKKEAPAVIFIDEIDSVGRARGTGLGGGHDEREQTLNQILSEMDGFSPWHAVIVLAATNRPDVLDSALLRPGRFDRKITTELPRKDARRKILQVHSRKVPLAPDVDLDVMARRTAGFSGADLENLVNEAALLAARDNKDQVRMVTLEEARDRIALGAQRENLLSEEEKRRVAFHESGHAILAILLPNTDPLDKVTIIPRGLALGATEQLPEEERYNLSESYLCDRITVMLGGRIAEKLVFGETSSGAQQDLEQATKLARRMITRWGMSEKLGPVAFHQEEDHIFLGREIAQPRTFSEHTAQIIDDEVRNLIGEMEARAIKLLQEHRSQLDTLANALHDKEILEAREIHEILDHTAKVAVSQA